MTSKGRIEYIDLAKGFCILLVIAYHIDEFHLPFQMASLFRMPLYFFLSGLFFKTYSGFKEFAIKKVNRLLVPLLFFYVFGFVYYCIEYWDYPSFEAITKEDTIYANPPIWFLISLFEVNLLSYAIFKLSRGRLAVMAVMFAVAGVGGYLLNVYKINIPLYVDTSLTCSVFFFMGYVLKHKSSYLYPNKIVLLCVHFPLLIFLNKHFTNERNWWIDLIFFVVIVSVSSAFIPLLKRFVPKLIAQEDLIKVKRKSEG